MGKFALSRRSNGEYQFLLKAGNGETILTSEGYVAKSNAIDGIESVRSNGPRMDRYELKQSTTGRYYFNLKSSNGAVIGSSEMYESIQGRENGIRAVMQNMVGSPIEDTTVEGLPLYTSISQFVKDKRKQLDLSQWELANKAGVGIRFIRELEGGDKDTLRIDKVNQVLQLFGYTLGPVPINRNDVQI